MTRAIISVYDKAGLDRLAVALHQAGVEIVSTGSTAAAIAAAGVPVTPVEQVTGFAECLDGRVKTLHPAIHAGLLADLREPSHADQLAALGIAPFQLLVSNLYPFTQTVASGASPQRVRRADRHRRPGDGQGGGQEPRQRRRRHQPGRLRPGRQAALSRGGFTLAEQRRRLAAQAFAHTAAYDAAVASWFASAYAPDETAGQTGWPDVIAATWRRRDVLRYGENPHQRAALYVPSASGAAGPARRTGSLPPSSCTARRCRTTTTSTPTRPGGSRATSPRPASRSSSTRIPAGSRLAPTSRRAPQGARLRPGVSLRRRHRGEPDRDR